MTTSPSPSPDMSTPPRRVIDRRLLPAGVVPRHLQQWVLVGVALVMVGILVLSGPPATPRTKPPTSPASLAVDPNQQRIEDYQRRIQEQTQRLAAEQAQLQLTKEALAADPGVGQRRVGPLRPATDGGVSAGGTEGRPDAHEDRARFADSVAFSRSGNGAVPFSTTAAVASAPSPAEPDHAPVPPDGAAVNGTRGLRYTLFEGTFIDTVLTNRLDGTFSGPVNCLVSVPVYAADRLVIPAGARVLGEARAVTAFGQSRLAVTFHRVILPNGSQISLDQFHGLNQGGDLGLRDQVDRHYAQIFGVSLALGAIAGFAQGASAVGLEATTVDTYRQGVAASVSQSSARVLDRFLNLLPTVTIREGHRIKVVLSQDLALPEYQPASAHTGGHS